MREKVLERKKGAGARGYSRKDKVAQVVGNREERKKQKEVGEIVGKNKVGQGEGKWARHVKEEGAGRSARNLKKR